MRATVPLTTPAAMLVPLNLTYERPPSVSRSAGKLLKSVCDELATDSSRWPGATMSGLTNPSYHVGPRELYSATTSSVRVVVSNVRVAPTVMADGAFPGELMPA